MSRRSRQQAFANRIAERRRFLAEFRRWSPEKQAEHGRIMARLGRQVLTQAERDASWREFVKRWKADALLLEATLEPRSLDLSVYTGDFQPQASETA